MNAPTDPGHRDPLPGWAPPPPTRWPASPPASPAATSPTGPPTWSPGGENPPPTWPHAPFDGGEPTPKSTLGLQNLLLILGTSLVAVAALVFMAVNWSRLGARFQGAILLGISAVVGVVAASCSRRRLPATAEALGVVGVLLAVVDAHALRVGLHPNVSGPAWWAAALLLVSGVAWMFSESTGIESPRVVAAALAQVPLFLVAFSVADLTWSQCELLLLAQVAVVALLTHGASDRYRRAGAVALTVAFGSGLFAVGAALVEVAWRGGSDRGPALVLAVAAAVAALTAGQWADREPVRVPSLLFASLLGLVSVAVALPTVVSGPMAAALVVLVATTMVGVALRVDRRWGAIPALVGAVTSTLWSAPVLVAINATANDLGRAIDRAWAYELGDRASSLYLANDVIPAGALAVYLSAFALLAVAAAPVLRRRGTAWALVAVASTAVFLAPAMGPISLVVAAVLPFALAGILVAASTGLVGWSHTDRRLATGAASALVMLGLGWAVAVTPLTVGALAAVTLLAIAVAIGGRARLDLGLAAGTAVVAVGAGAALAAAGFAADGMGAGAAWAAGAVAAGVLGLVAVLLLDLDRDEPEEAVGRLDRTLAIATEVAAWTVHAAAFVAVVGLDDRSALSVVLAAGTIAAGLHAARPHRRPLALAAAAQGLLFAWLRLLEGGVRAPEPFVLPLAVVLGVVGLLAERRAARAGERLASWTTIGPALVIGFAPSAWLAFAEGGVARPLATLAAGGVVLALGALTGRRAAVDVGVAVVVALGLRQIAPVVGSLPGWVTIGATGALLLAVGATFEQRRRDVDDVRRHYQALV